MKQKIFIALFFGVFLAVGSAVAVHGIKTVNNARASLNWPKAPAMVKVSQMEVDTDSDSVTYSAEIMYEYQFNQQIYSSHKVSFGQYGSSNPKHAREIVNRYPVGSYIYAYYDPMDPSVSVLEPGTTWSSYMLLIIGGIFATVGLFGVLGVLSRAKY